MPTNPNPSSILQIVMDPESKAAGSVPTVQAGAAGGEGEGRPMSAKIRVPDEMLKAAVKAGCAEINMIGGTSPSIYHALEAALRWLSENPIEPTERQAAGLFDAVEIPAGFDLKKDMHQYASLLAIEWQRRMFLAPDEPKLDSRCICCGQVIEMVKEKESKPVIPSAIEDLLGPPDGWIACEDKFPPLETLVDIWLRGTRYTNIQRVNVENEGWFWCNEDGDTLEEAYYDEDCGEDVKFWRPLPTPPVREKEGRE